MIIHGKEYITVAERVNLVHASGKTFEMISSEPMSVGDRLLWEVAIKVNEQQCIGHAEVKLNADKRTPDGQCPFECAETSALGRALGFAGFGSAESIASADEIVRSQPRTEAEKASVPPATVETTQETAAPPETVPAQPSSSISFNLADGITQDQLDTLRKLYEKHKQTPPENLARMTKDEARAEISSIQKCPQYHFVGGSRPMGFTPNMQQALPRGDLNVSRGFSLMR